MTLSINLRNVKCIKESTELSASDEPYVLVTSVAFQPVASIPGLPTLPTAGDVRTHLYGKWKMDAGDEITVVTEPPFWGPDSEPQNITNVNNVFLIITVMENDAGSPSMYRFLVQTIVTIALFTSVSAPNLAARKARILKDLRSFLDGFPTNDIPGIPSDDHVGTDELVLDPSDLITFGIKDRKLTIDGGDEGKYELTFRIMRRQITIFAQDAKLAAVSRHPGHMEIWGIDVSGMLRGNWFDGRWQGWYRLAGAQFHQGNAPVAVSRHDNHMEIWAIGQDGFVRGIWFEGGWRNWYKLDDQVEHVAKFNQGTPLAVVSRHRNHMELFGVDETGHLRHCWFDDGRWHGWSTLELPGGAFFPSGSQLTALSRHGGHMEVWVLDDNGTFRGIHFLENSWRNWITFGGASFLPGTHIEAISRHADHMELFAVDSQGILRGNRFDGEWQSLYRWYPFVNAAFTPGADIAAVSRHPDRMELWVLGKDDGVIHGNWFDQSSWQSNWYLLGNAQFNKGVDLTAVSRSYLKGGFGIDLLREQERMELWTVGQDGVVRGDSFDGQWRGWYELRWSYEG